MGVNYDNTLSPYFLVKLQDLFKDETIRNFFITSGRQMIADLLINAERVSWWVHVVGS